MGERGRTALAMLLMPAIVVAVAWCAAALWFDRPFDRLRVPSTVEGHLDPFEQPGRKRVVQYLVGSLPSEEGVWRRRQ